ncbi:Hypothetical protein NGAL_HAMBI1145_29270 [Neorhizobium galegae bv. officinalis]|uniref:Uncharacterized protein n=1 Tax=Neorhizobium galegae bv. officinalis TaxID=323656 RepID=A0A0T7FKS0_NEOGA|nr:Hypothetical protein NGAL_HAMBI1145_29270 [Neorhizobium galegae bv. officinalis]
MTLVQEDPIFATTAYPELGLHERVLGSNCHQNRRSLHGAAARSDDEPIEVGVYFTRAWTQPFRAPIESETVTASSRLGGHGGRPVRPATAAPGRAC